MAFYRKIKLELSLKKDERTEVNKLFNWSSNKYEKLILESPNINRNIINRFLKECDDVSFSKPYDKDITIIINED